MKAGIVCAAGIGAGSLFHATLAAIGISALIAASDIAFDVLRWVGAGYLIWIGIKNIREGQQPFDNPVEQNVPYWSLFNRGLLINILNPKVALFFIAFLPQFIDTSQGNVAFQIFILGCFVGISGTIVNSLVGIFAGGSGRLILQNPVSMKWISRISGILIVGLGLRLLFLEKN